MCENDDASGLQVEKDVRFLGRVAQEFEVQAVRSEFWRCRDSRTQAGIRYLGRRKKGGESPPIADAFAARDHWYTCTEAEE